MQHPLLLRAFKLSPKNVPDERIMKTLEKDTKMEYREIERWCVFVTNSLVKYDNILSIMLLNAQVEAAKGLSYPVQAHEV